MISSRKNAMKNIYKWIYGFAGAMLTAWLGSYFYDNTKNIPVLKYITGALNWIYDSGVAVLNYKVKVGVFLVTLVVFRLLYKLYKSDTEKEALPDFTNYQKDIFKTWIWRWDWNLTNDGWKPINLTAYCQKDDVEFIENGDIFTSRYYCPKCGIKYDEVNNPVETVKEAKVLLLDKVNKNTYPKS
jgi:hypothetical protein